MSKSQRTLSVNTHEAKTKLSALLKAVEEEDAVVRICRNDKPVAELRRIAAAVRDPFTPHPRLSTVVFDEDPVAPGSAEDWPEEAR